MLSITFFKNKYSYDMINNYCCNSTSPDYNTDLEICKCTNERDFICEYDNAYPTECKDFKYEINIAIHAIPVFLIIGFFSNSRFSFKREKENLIYLILLLPIALFCLSLYYYIYYDNIGFNVVSEKEKMDILLPSLFTLIICLLFVIYKNQVIKNKSMIFHFICLFMSIIFFTFNMYFKNYNYDYETTFNKCCINETILNDNKVLIIIIK